MKKFKIEKKRNIARQSSFFLVDDGNFVNCYSVYSPVNIINDEQYLVLFNRFSNYYHSNYK